MAECGATKSHRPTEQNMARSAVEIAEQLFKNIEAKQVDAVAALYHDDIEVWHNFSNAIQSKADNLKVLKGLTLAATQIRYEVLERHLFGNRVVQRHNLHCRLADNADIVIPACIFITVENEKITRIDEYLDTAQTARLRSPTARAAPAR
jgi:ketosteroid isomerase-like protein